MSNLAVVAFAVTAVVVSLLGEARRPRRPDRRSLAHHARALKVLAGMAAQRPVGTPHTSPREETHRHPGPERVAATGSHRPDPPSGMAILGPSGTPAAQGGSHVAQWRPVPQPVVPTQLQVTRIADRPKASLTTRARTDDGVVKLPPRLPGSPAGVVDPETPHVRQGAHAPRGEIADALHGTGDAPARPTPAMAAGGTPTSAAPRGPRTTRHAAMAVFAAGILATGSVVLGANASTVVVPSVAPGAMTPAVPSPASSAGAPDALPAPLAPATIDGDVAAYLVTEFDEVTVTATDRSWLRVRTPDGGILTEGTLEAGEVAAVVVSGTAEVRLGNPDGVTVRAGTRALDLPPSGGSPLTLVLDVPD